MIFDADVHVFPAHAAAVALASAIAGDAVADLVELAELFDVDVDQLAGMLAFITTNRRGRLQCAELVEPTPPQDAADGGGRDTDLGGNLFAGVALSAQSLDDGACGQRSLVWR